MQNSLPSPHVLELLRFTETHQRHTEALIRATGEGFNVFKILGMEALEVKTHSAFLGELLNPQGAHGQGCLFLEPFLSSFAESQGDDASFAQKIREFQAESATLKLEVYIGQINANHTEGGRIDIVLTDKNNGQIFIENKIFAADQKKQLSRYHKDNPKAALFYLTLDGKPPSPDSLGEDKFYVHSISYQEHIVRWLKICRKEAAGLPIIRESITQYIQLIEKLTNQSTTITMNKALITEILKDKNSLAAFFTLRNAEMAIQNELIARLDGQLEKKAEKLGLRQEKRINKSFYFKTKELEALDLQIGFEFQSSNDYKNLVFGFKKTNESKINPVIEEQFLNRFKERFSNCRKSDWWPAYAFFDSPYKDWNAEAFEAIQSGQLAENLDEKLVILSEITMDVCKAS